MPLPGDALIEATQEELHVAETGAVAKGDTLRPTTASRIASMWSLLRGMLDFLSEFFTAAAFFCVLSFFCLRGIWSIIYVPHLVSNTDKSRMVTVPSVFRSVL